MKKTLITLIVILTTLYANANTKAAVTIHEPSAKVELGLNRVRCWH